MERAKFDLNLSNTLPLAVIWRAVSPHYLGCFFCEQEKMKKYSSQTVISCIVSNCTNPFWMLICLKGCPILTGPNLFSTLQLLTSEKAIDFMVKYCSAKVWDYDISCQFTLHYWQTRRVKAKNFPSWSPALQIRCSIYTSPAAPLPKCILRPN